MSTYVCQQRMVQEQEQLLADAERERGELATQLIARDRQVSELQARLSRVELTSSELEAALRAQLDLATQQCDQYEARVRDLDNSTKVQKCQRQTTLRSSFTLFDRLHFKTKLFHKGVC